MHISDVRGNKEERHGSHCQRCLSTSCVHLVPDGRSSCLLRSHVQAVLVDWAMARDICGSQHDGITQGTPAYASPEQLTGYNPELAWGDTPRLSPSADLWALGATLYEMLAGDAPFGGGCFEELVAAVMQLSYDQSFGRNSAASEDARRVVASMLQLRPSERATVAELCSEPWVLLGGEMPTAVGLPASSGATQHAQASVLRSKGMALAMGEYEVVGILDVFHELAARWQRHLIGAIYIGMVITSLLWHLSSDQSDLPSEQWKWDV